MRVLFFSSIFPRPDNPTRGVFCYHYCRGVQALGHEVRVISPRPWRERRLGKALEPLPGLKEIPAEYPTFYYMPGALRSTYGPAMWMCTGGRLRSAMKEYRPDLVLSYWAHPDGAVAGRAAREAGVPCGIIVGGSDVLILAKQPGLRRRGVIRSLERADAVFTVGNHLRRAVLGLGIDEGKVHAIYQGVDRKVFHPGEPGEARRRLGIEEAGRVLLYVGNLVHVKGLDVLLTAVGKLRDRGEQFRLYMVGSGPLKETLAGQVAELGLGDRVTFVGPVPQPKLGDWYRAADLTVMSSRSEGIPNALRESMACNTPFVATDVGGISELAEGTRNILVPAGDAEALAEAVAKRLAEGRVGVARDWMLGTWAQSVERMLGILAASGGRGVTPAAAPESTAVAK